MKPAFMVLALTLAGSAASAQTTHCQQSIIGMPSAGVTCTTSGGASAPSVPYRWQDVEPKPCNFFERGAGIADLCSARQVAANRKAVGELIGQGRCDEAFKSALATGDLDFAREVRDFCAAPTR